MILRLWNSSINGKFHESTPAGDFMSCLQPSPLAFVRETGAPMCKVPAYQLWAQLGQKTNSVWLVTVGVLNLRQQGWVWLTGWQKKNVVKQKTKSVVKLRHIWKVLIKVFWSSAVNTSCHVYRWTWEALEKVKEQW